MGQSFSFIVRFVASSSRAVCRAQNSLLDDEDDDGAPLLYPRVTHGRTDFGCLNQQSRQNRLQSERLSLEPPFAAIFSRIAAAATEEAVTSYRDAGQLRASEGGDGFKFSSRSSRR